MLPPGSPPESASFAVTQRLFTRHLREPGRAPAPADVSAERIEVYRDLVYRNVDRMISNLFPVLRKITPDDRWEPLVRDFFARHRCRTGLFTKIPFEFLQFLEEERDDPTDPPFIAELAHYECMEYAATIDPKEVDATGIDAGGDLLGGVPALSPLARPLRYQFPVQHLSPTNLPAEAPAQYTYIVVCRTRADKVEFTELNPVSARLVELIQNNGARTGRELLLQIAEELHHPDPDVVIRGGRDILARLHAKDVILGTRAHARH
jgi:hypothetical protein